MTYKNELQRILNLRSLIRFALIGAGIAVVFFNIFIIATGHDYHVPFLVPMATIAIGGAGGGIFYHIMGYVRNMGGWKKVAAIVFSVLAYIVAMWISMVYGFFLIGLWH